MSKKRKCDLQTPRCSRCAKNNLHCIYANAVASNIHSFLPERTVQRELQEQSAHARSLQWRRAEYLQLVARRSVTDNSIVRFDQSPTWKRQLESLYLESFLPSDVSPKYGFKGSWVKDVLETYNRTRGLETALQALYLCRLGQLKSDESLRRLGLRSYGVTIKQLAHSVQDKDLLLTDETFVISKVLSIYELSEATTGSNSSWAFHISGIEHLIKARGKNRHVSGLTESLMKSARYDAMVLSIVYRRSSPLGDPEWRTTAWDEIIDFEQQLYDIGFDLGALLENVKPQRNETMIGQPPTTSSVVNRALRIDKALAQWFERFGLWGPNPLYWVVKPVDGEGTNHDLPFTVEEEIQFPDARLAYLLHDFWALGIISGAVVRMIYDSFLSNDADPTALMLGDAAAWHKHNDAILATRILCSVSYTQGSGRGFLGPSRVMFANRVALYFFRVTHRPLDAWRIEALITHYSAARGLGFATSLASQAGEWE